MMVLVVRWVTLIDHIQVITMSSTLWCTPNIATYRQILYIRVGYYELGCCVNSIHSKLWSVALDFGLFRSTSAQWSVAVGGVKVGWSGHQAIGVLIHINTVDGCRGSWYWLCVLVCWWHHIPTWLSITKSSTISFAHVSSFRWAALPGLLRVFIWDVGLHLMKLLWKNAEQRECVEAMAMVLLSKVGCSCATFLEFLATARGLL